MVEDEEIVRNLLCRLLKVPDVDILSASNGQEGLELFLQNQNYIKIVITDMAMPVINGPTMVRKIREVNSDVAIVFMSGDLGVFIGDLPLADAIFTKPIIRTELLERLVRL